MYVCMYVCMQITVNKLRRLDWNFFYFQIYLQAIAYVYTHTQVKYVCTYPLIIGKHSSELFPVTLYVSAPLTCNIISFGEGGGFHIKSKCLHCKRNSQ